MTDTADITELLDAARDGDRGALDRVLATLYQELHSMARRQLAGQHGHTLDATALVHEAYLKLVGRSATRSSTTARTSSPMPPRRCAAWWSTTRASAWRRSAAATCTASPTCPRTSKAACAWTRKCSAWTSR